MHLIPIILSGGTGSRLWPLSRESHPKPFITLPDGQSLLQKTFSRAVNCSPITPISEILTVTNKEYYLKTKAEYEKVSLASHPNCHFLLEPTARNTAPAILLAALDILERHGEIAMMLVLPADHLIKDQAAFQQACAQAYELAIQNQLVTFGILPTRAETGFGYIELGKQLNEKCFEAKQFVEKPDKTTAMHYLTSERYLWNAGMFCFSVQTILAAYKQHQPDLFKLAVDIHQKARHSPIYPATTEFTAEQFNALPAISIDYAVMEKATNIAVVRGEFQWCDIGSFEAYQHLFKADDHGNTLSGDTVLIDATNNLIHSEDRLVAAIGIDHLAVIDTPDALLITQRDRCQAVKDVVQVLKQRNHESYMTHRTVIRPWGSYTVLEQSQTFKIKRIVVKPKGTLSLQLHKHRSEHWVVVAGTAKVVNGEREYVLKTNESSFIPMNTPHRLSNPTDEDLVIIEVQTGAYVAEDDIIRLEDTYGRATTETEEAIA